MTGLGQEYSRHSFEQSNDSETLARDLSGILAQRLNAAKNPRSEADVVVEELKLLGHLLFSWDEDEDWQVWGDDYTRPRPNRFIVELRYPVGERASADVTFGPWPEAVPPPACQRCGAPMVPSSLRVRGIGHGHVASREVEVELFLGEQDKRTITVGQRSSGYQVAAFWCGRCNALWVPDAARGGWTG
jgi:hypothetical protein